MKKSQIEKELRKQLSDATPSNFEDLCARCNIGEKEEVFAEEMVAVGTKGGNYSFSTKKKVGITTALVFLVALTIFLALFFTLSNNGANDILPSGKGFLIIDINPSIELSYNDKGVVTSAKGLNKDGEVLLSGLDIKDKDYRAVADLLFEKCVKLGYFSADRENNAILVTATTEDGNKDDKWSEEIKGVFLKTFSSQNIKGVVITGIKDAELDKKGEQYGIDGQKYALIQDLLALGGHLDEEDYATISIRDLYSEIAEQERKNEEEKIENLTQQSAQMKDAVFADLLEVISEFIDQLADDIEDQYKEDHFHKNKYERKLEELEDYLEDIEEEKIGNKNIKVFDRVTTVLKDLVHEEHNPKIRALLEEAYDNIKNTLLPVIDVISEIDILDTSIEDINSARYDKYKDSHHQWDDDFDYDQWQEDKEDDFSSSWYDFKHSWEQERDDDLDDWEWDYDSDDEWHWDWEWWHD